MLKLLPHYLAVLCLLLAASSCGRKRKSVFLFQSESSKKINKLDCPSVRGVRVERRGPDNYIFWLPIDKGSMPCVGYTVYRLSRPLIIAKKPLHKDLLRDLFYIDRAACGARQDSFYLVRPVFEKEKKQVEGPASAITGVQK